ncbi:MAG: septum formation initiator family protein [Prevotella sp.]|nr:septum formation initiator family protein [Prevotella sp.]
MSTKLSHIWNFLAKNKYLITSVVGIAVVGFIDENSFMKRIEYELQISQMKDEIKKFDAQNEKSTKALNDLQRNPKAIEKIARERYFMKADDEDIYVLSTDQQAAEDEQAKSNEIDETVK